MCLTCSVHSTGITRTLSVCSQTFHCRFKMMYTISLPMWTIPPTNRSSPFPGFPTPPHPQTPSVSPQVLGCQGGHRCEVPRCVHCQGSCDCFWKDPLLKIIEEKAEVNGRNWQGKTPLLVAAQHGHVCLGFEKMAFS